MAFIGAKPTNVPLTANDITDGSISVAKLTSTLDLSSNTVTLPSGVGGKVLQVVTATKTDTASATSSSFSDITGLSINITPSSTSNKILIIGDISASSNSGDAGMGVRIEQDISGGSVTYPYVGNSAGSRTQSSFGAYVFSDDNFQGKYSSSVLLSPNTTSEITFTYQFRSQNTSPVYINRSVSDGDEDSTYRNASSITAFEIAG